MEAIILAGGFGTRLREVVSDVPKPMAPVGDKPFLEIIINNLIKHGVKRIVLAVGYKSEIIVDYFGNSYKGIELIYSFEDEPLGTGGCITKAIDLITEDRFYVINGDTFFDINLNNLKLVSADIVIASKEMYNFDRYGKLVIDFNDKLLAFAEKQYNEHGFINAGIYLINKDVFSKFELPKKFSLETDFFEKYITELDIKVVKFNNYFIDIGIPSDYIQFQKDIKDYE